MSRGSVGREKNGSWSIVLDVPTASGARRQVRRRGFATKRAANDALAELATETNRGATVAPARLTLETFARDQWLPAIEPTVAAVTFVRYEKALSTHILPHLGRRPIASLNGADLSKLYASLLKNGKQRGGGLAPATVRFAHVVLHRLLKDAMRWGLINRNAADAADPPRVVATGALKAWTPAQLKAFLSMLKDERLRAAYVLAATTGMRRSELCGLRWSDVDLDEGTITIRQSAVVIYHRVEIGRPKTARSRRSVSLDATTLSILREHRQAMLGERLRAGPSWHADGDFVFVWPDGRPIHPHVISRTFDRLVASAKLPRITLHGLRHSWATAALVAGVPVKVVSDRLGHSSSRITLDVYTHAVPNLDRAAAETVAALMFDDDNSAVKAQSRAE